MDLSNVKPGRICGSSVRVIRFYSNIYRRSSWSTSNISDCSPISTNMGRLATISTCQLNQWALDFDGNRDRILEAIRQAKAAGSRLILTPELCIPGYGLLDHFLELDTFSHSWEVVAEIISSPDTQDIIIDLGLPVRHNGNPFNARVIALNGKILAIRPKIWLCNDGNYREMRYFTAWKRRLVETYTLPDNIQELTGQREVPIGDIIFEALDATFASETCEELWTPDSPHAQYTLNGVEIILNSSGSHHELRKLDTRINLILEATAKSGGVYMYSNQRGCDGDRLYYDGCSLILVNGKTLAQGTQFSLRDVEVLTSTMDLDDIWSSRSSRSRGAQSMEAPRYERVKIDFAMTKKSQFNSGVHIAKQLEPRYHKPEEEIALGPACWLWDYLRRSKAAGYFVPLSGGIDSCATATIVFSMCRLVISGIKDGDKQVIEDATRLCQGADVSKMSAQDFCNKVFCTAFMGMKEQSSKETRGRAKDLAAAIGAHHIDCDIDEVFHAVKNLVSTTLKFEPKFKVYGGSPAENLALQNFQSRTRMILSYALGQLLPTSRGLNGGGLLVLGSANVDEALRGYLTKYDCSSADINPIGGISKTDLISFIGWAENAFGLPILQQFIDATPTAELEPITSDYVQSDEVDSKSSQASLLCARTNNHTVGMTYKVCQTEHRL